MQRSDFCSSLVQPVGNAHVELARMVDIVRADHN
jgi:hypothetical protein